MMISEFISLTDFTPTAREYREIEEQYIDSDLDKMEFCNRFVDKGGIIKIADQRLKGLQHAEEQYETFLQRVLKEREQHYRDLVKLRQEMELKVLEAERRAERAEKALYAISQITKEF